MKRRERRAPGNGYSIFETSLFAMTSSRFKRFDPLRKSRQMRLQNCHLFGLASSKGWPEN
jgi:hypothetical protein